MQQSPLDSRLASLGLLLGAGMIGYSYYRSREGVGPMAPGKGAAAAVGGAAPLDQLTAWAKGLGLTVTSGVRSPEEEKALGGAASSLHVSGRAIDVGVHGLSPTQIQAIIQDAIGRGWNAFLEGSGMTRYGYSSGPHIHVSISPPGSTAK